MDRDTVKNTACFSLYSPGKRPYNYSLDSCKPMRNIQVPEF